MSKLRPLLIFGTRPEAIKMAPVVCECGRRSGLVEATVCVTGQHREMLDQVLASFPIHVDDRLAIGSPNHTLAALTARCVEGIDRVLRKHRPDCVVIQGDTTTAMATALAAFYRRLPVVHVEAGLRTGNLQAPWPEELDRRIVTLVSTLHCAPTQRAADALLAEGVAPECVRVTGNTVVDALLQTLERLREGEASPAGRFPELGGAGIVLITGHRRESFGQALENICRAIAVLAARFNDHKFVYPVHINPNVFPTVRRILGDCDNVHLMAPLPYPDFVRLMERSTLILTDSGGVQEEAPTLNKPVLVMRETTERIEAVEAGAAQLVGTSTEGIVQGVSTLLNDPVKYAASRPDCNPFGDGRAAERIVEWMLQQGWG